MSLAGNYQLNRMYRICQDANQTFRVMQKQIGAFVRCKTACEAQCQIVWVEYRLRGFRLPAARSELPGEALAHEANQFKTVPHTEIP